MKEEKDLFAQYKEDISQTFLLYHQLFLSLPFEEIKAYGDKFNELITITFLLLKKRKTPDQILSQFFNEIAKVFNLEKQKQMIKEFALLTKKEKVVFQSLENISFPSNYYIDGVGSLNFLLDLIESYQANKKAISSLKNYQLNLTIPFYKTPFYSKKIDQLSQKNLSALIKGDIESITKNLEETAKTAFLETQIKQEDKNKAFIKYLDSLIYPLFSNFQQSIDNKFNLNKSCLNLKIDYFDENQNKTSQSLLDFLTSLEESIKSKYLHDLSFIPQSSQIQENLKKGIYREAKELISDLENLKSSSDQQEKIHLLQSSVHVFGFHYASLDLQVLAKDISSSFLNILSKAKIDLPLAKNYQNLNYKEQILILEKLIANKVKPLLSGETCKILDLIKLTKEKPTQVYRLVIKSVDRPSQILEAYYLLSLCFDRFENIPVDIVPCIDSKKELLDVKELMNNVYDTLFYYHHLKQRKSKQAIFFDFSSSLQQKGFFYTNFDFFLQKIELNKQAKERKINLVTIDCPTSPASSNGIFANEYYRAIADSLSLSSVDLYVSKEFLNKCFSAYIPAKFHLEQTFTSLLAAIIFPNLPNQLTVEDHHLLDEIARSNLFFFQQITSDPNFHAFKNLFEIPFISFFGLGQALKKLIERANLPELCALYQHNLFFKMILDNGAKAICKDPLPHLCYLEFDKRFCSLYKRLLEEYYLLKQLIKRITNSKHLFEHLPSLHESLKTEKNFYVIDKLIQIEKPQNF